MPDDAQAIRDLVATWLRASAAGDLDAILALMAEDVIFLVPGQPPLRGRAAFAAAHQAMAQRFRLEAIGDIQEIQVVGAMAWCWNHLTVTVTPIAGGAPMRRSGNVLSVLRKEPDGRWVIVRDANLLTVG